MGNSEFELTLHYSEERGNAQNCSYQNTVTVTSVEELARYLCYDHVLIRFRDGYRSKENFMDAETAVFDCDNDHTEDRSLWITPEDMESLFPGVRCITTTSRHHLKQKGTYGPRPRFHIIFFIEKITTPDAFSEFMKEIQNRYPFFDGNALDAARFFYGSENVSVQLHPGQDTLTAFLEEEKQQEAFQNLGQAIPEGSRNSTMSRIGAKIIKRYGDTPEARELFFKAAEQCDPPLEDAELEQIWKGKQRFYEKLSKQPGYILPNNYNNGTSSLTWDTPIPFEEYDLPTFPVEALPEVVRRYVLAVAVSTQTTADMAAVEALGVVSLCSQGKYTIQGNTDWVEPLNTYTVVILPPAERKSSVLSMMIHPVEEYEQAENIRRNAQIIESQMLLRKLEKEKKALEDQAAKGKATEAEIKAKAAEIAGFEPIKPLRLFVDDVTVEKLTSVLAENKGRAAVVSAEGGIFDIISGLYSKNVNIDVFLKGHSGDTIRVDRIGRASESIIHPALTMVLAVQPEVLNGLMSNNTFRGRGLTARFLYAMPKSTIGTRSFATEPIPEGTHSRYQQLIEDILSGNNNQEPLSLDAEAAEVLESLFNEIEGRLKGDLAEIPDWAGKFVGVVLRISGILHIMKHPRESMFDTVSKETMENAVIIGRYFLEHAKAAYSLMGADATNKNAQYLLTAIKQEQIAEFSRRDAMRLCRRFKTAESLQPVLDRLCEYGYLAVKPQANTFGLGRKPSEVYLTNPAVLDGIGKEGRS